MHPTVQRPLGVGGPSKPGDRDVCGAWERSSDPTLPDWCGKKSAIMPPPVKMISLTVRGKNRPDHSGPADDVASAGPPARDTALTGSPTQRPRSVTGCRARKGAPGRLETHCRRPLEGCRSPSSRSDGERKEGANQSGELRQPRGRHLHRPMPILPSRVRVGTNGMNAERRGPPQGSGR